MTPTEQEVRLAQKVALLAKDETFLAIMEATKAHCRKQWEKASSTPESREEAWMKLQGVLAIETQMKAAIDRGTVPTKK